VYLENSLPDGIVLGFQIFPGGSGGCEMIHDHLRHFLSEEVVCDDGMGLGLDLELDLGLAWVR